MAEETSTPATSPVESPAAEAPPKTDTGNLTDADRALLEQSKIPSSQYSKVTNLSKASGKSVDEILKMRLEQKMGWGKIAKELGVHPGTLGNGEGSKKEAHSRAEKTHDKMERHHSKMEKHQDKKQKSGSEKN